METASSSSSLPENLIAYKNVFISTQNIQLGPGMGSIVGD
jgi:hypothetical protein